MTRILCVDDNDALTDLLCYGFAREGFEVTTAASGREALRMVRADSFDLITLDINLPDINGIKVLSILRAFSSIPIVILTARAQDEDVIAGLDAGADDYVIKPFNLEVLVLRAKAVLRRMQLHATSMAIGQDGAEYRVAGALLDTAANELVTDEGIRVRLTPTERRILQTLLAHEGQALSSDRIVEYIRGYTKAADSAIVKTHIRRLREKIATLPGAPSPILTLPGVGYITHRTPHAPPLDERHVAGTQCVVS
jgi:DNA-binding response OmpR family regulator